MPIFVDFSDAGISSSACAVMLFCDWFRDGVSRCGVYCTVSTTWDKLVSERQADVFQTIFSIKRNRPQLVCDKVTYQHSR